MHNKKNMVFILVIELTFITLKKTIIFHGDAISLPDVPKWRAKDRQWISAELRAHASVSSP